MYYTQTKDFIDETWFLVVKLGASRLFEFTNAETGDIVFTNVIEAGTGVWVRAKGVDAANARVKHGVPVIDEPCRASGSLVFRCIATVVPYVAMLWKVAESADRKAKVAAAREAEAAEFAANVLRIDRRG